MASLRYLNGVLTILTVLTAMLVWTLWTASPAGEALSFSQSAQAAAPRGIPNAGDQRKQIVDQVRINNQKMDALIGLLKSGQVRVRLESNGEDKNRK